MKKCFKWLFGNKKIIDCQIDIVSISNIECCICYNIYEKDDIMAFIPCGHRVCCNNCIEEIKYSKRNCCPVCNTDIKDKIKIYENIIHDK